MTILNNLRRKFLLFLIKRTSLSWTSVDKNKLLFYTNNYLTLESWIEKFELMIPDYKDIYELIFVKTKIKFLKLIPNANAVFCFGLSTSIDLSATAIKEIYFASSGIEFLEGRLIPDNVKIHSAIGISKKAIAEYVLMTALILKSRYYFAARNQISHTWDQKPLINTPYKELNQSTIGIIGIGNVGKEIANKFKSLGCHTIGLDKIQSANLAIDEWYSLDDIKYFLNKSDFVIISIPLTLQTRELFDKEHLSAMKPTSVLINISRGAIINENDLIWSLKNKVISGAALDVFSNEPLHKNSKLWELNNVIITPHIAGNINMFSNQIQEDFIKKVVMTNNTSI
jgi:D-2-hydroxyacid dehydrogenase (NADP+)